MFRITESFFKNLRENNRTILPPTVSQFEETQEEVKRDR